MDDLKQKRCKPCEGGTDPLSQERINELLKQVPSWKQDDKIIFRHVEFKNYFRTMSFVNALAWVAHRENHHPDLFVSYNACRISYTTHAISGLSENDFICAAKIDELLA